MKNLNYTTFFFIALFSIMTQTMEAQKVGYVNSQAILAEMPEVQQMNANLQTFGTQLQKQGENMLEKYKQKEQDAMQKKESGQLSPIEEQTVLEELQKAQEEILQFEKDMQQQLLEKEQELLAPIYAKINNAISSVAKENGFKMILEAGILLWADEELDASSLVKAKLGL